MEARSVARRFASQPASARLARRWAAEVAAGWGVAEVETLALLTSELTTNVVRHAGTDFDVRVTLDADRLRVEVRDDDPRYPVLSAPTSEGTPGRGLAVVETLASAWGFEENGEGKVVWFELPPLTWS